jgi:hypothetical protein
MDLDFSRLNPKRLAVGLSASAILIITILFLPWYSLEENPQRVAGEPNDETWLCGTGDTSCTAFEVFPILRWLLLLAALAPVILAWILIRSHRLGWTPGEMTMVAGFAAAMLIGYNGIIDKPGSGPGEIGVSLDYGYWIALICSVVIAAVGFTRAEESGPRKGRKAPGTV